MNNDQAQELLIRTARNKRAILEEARQQAEVMQEQTRDVLAQWVTEEFTSETIWNDGILETFLPWINQRGTHHRNWKMLEGRAIRFNMFL